MYVIINLKQNYANLRYKFVYHVIYGVNGIGKDYTR